MTPSAQISADCFKGSFRLALMSLSGAMYSMVPQMEGSTSFYFAMSPKSLKTILTECKTGYNVSQVGYYRA